MTKLNLFVCMYLYIHVYFHLKMVPHIHKGSYLQ